MDSWLAAELIYSDERSKRFGPDEKDEGDIPSAISFDTQSPGGFGSGSLVLPRPSKVEADDAALFSHARVYGPGSRTAYEGRVAGIPQVGANEIRLELDGWSEHLTDDETFRAIFVDRDLSHWGSTSNAWRLANEVTWGLTDASVTTDSGEPSLTTQFQGPWNGPPGLPMSQAWYDAGAGLNIESIYYAWKKNALINAGLTDWTWIVKAGVDEVETSVDSTGSLRTPGPGAGALVATGGNKRYGQIQLYNTVGPAGNENETFAIYWTCLAVYGTDLPKQGGTSQVEAWGVFGADVLAYALDHSAPLLNYTLGDSIEQSTIVIPHLVFLEPTTARSVVEQVTALGGAQLVPNDWGVYDNREFYWRSPGSYGRTWRVRKDQIATPTGEGPESKERIGGLMVSYRDGAGMAHSVGPPGSGAEYETTDLLDTDPNNPATRLGRRWAHRQVGITNQEGALNIGKLLLAEANQVNWRGSTTLKGEATDSAGNTHPTSAVRAGDRIVTEDDEYPTERPVNSTSYNHDDLSVTVNIGAPPHSAEVMLAQLEAATDLVAA